MAGKEAARGRAFKDKQRDYAQSLEGIGDRRHPNEVPDFGDADFKPELPHGGEAAWVSGDDWTVSKGFDRTHPAEAQRISDESGGQAL